MRSRLGLLDNLLSTVNGLRSKSVNSVWRGYYDGDSYSPESIEHKLSSVERFLRDVQPESVWDLGANEGRFNPSPQLGWANRERLGLSERGPTVMVMALALIHHLAISNNVPLPMIAEYFRSISDWAIVEFIPRTDPKVTTLLQSRNSAFQDYTQDKFEEAFSLYFEFKAKDPIERSERVLYLLKGLDVTST